MKHGVRPGNPGAQPRPRRAASRGSDRRIAQASRLEATTMYYPGDARKDGWSVRPNSLPLLLVALILGCSQPARAPSAAPDAGPGSGTPSAIQRRLVIAISYEAASLEA